MRLRLCVFFCQVIEGIRFELAELVEVSPDINVSVFERMK